MTIKELIEKLKEIEGTINDADISIPSNDIGTELSDVEYYVDSARDLVEGLIIELENDKEVWKYELNQVWKNKSDAKKGRFQKLN